MINLDDGKTIQKMDPKNVLGSIELLGEQCQQAWKEVKALNIPKKYSTVNKIVFSAMGGSALGAYIIKDLFFNELQIPFEIINDYNLPSYVDKNTLIILASYSGTTEETISCLNQAVNKKLACFVLTTGGKLADIAKERKLPAYIFNPVNNPSNQPRLGTGYSVFAQIALLNNLKLIEVSEKDVQDTISYLMKGNLLCGLNKETEDNPAKQLALNLYGKIPVIVVAQHLTGSGRVVRNQLHESAKNFADYYPVPELNHHLMESLGFPKTNKQSLAFVFFKSKLYSLKISKRIEITIDVVEKNGIQTFTYLPSSDNKITQAFECVQFGAYMNYYLGMLNGIDPSKIPWVDYFKAKLLQK